MNGIESSIRRRIMALVGIAIVAVCAPARAEISSCGGDCNTDLAVTVEEVVTLVGMAMGEVSMASCPAGDRNHDGQLVVDELVGAVNNALSGCSATVPVLPVIDVEDLAAGSTVSPASVAVTLTKNGAQVQSLGVDLVYDNSTIDVVNVATDCSLGPVATGCAVQDVIKQNPTTIRVTLACASERPNGVIVTCAFAVLAATPAIASIENNCEGATTGDNELVEGVGITCANGSVLNESVASSPTPTHTVVPPTPVPSATGTNTIAPTVAPSLTATIAAATPTDTIAVPTATNTEVPTFTATAIPTATLALPTATATLDLPTTTPTDTIGIPTETTTATELAATQTPSTTPTVAEVETPTSTVTTEVASPTATATEVAATETSTVPPTATASALPSETATEPLPTASEIASATPTVPPSATDTASAATGTPTATASATESAAATLTVTRTATVTPSGSAPDLDIDISRVADFALGHSGWIFLDVRNVGDLVTTAPITVTSDLPAGLRLLTADGLGWDCSESSDFILHCTHAGPLAPGASLPQIAASLEIQGPAGIRVTISATVSTPGDDSPGNDTATNVAVLHLC